MRDPRINFRSRELAALLAYLIPGAGHFYQGRRLKAGIYFGGILSLFFAGMALGDWQPVYYASTSYPIEMLSSNENGRVEFDEWEFRRSFAPTMGYAAQFFTGAVALPAIVQNIRLRSDPGIVRTLPEPVNSDFTGGFQGYGRFIPASGRLEITPGPRGSAIGKFAGELQSGETVDLEIAGNITLGREVFGSPRRKIILSLVDDIEIEGDSCNELRGTIERDFINWYQAPCDTEELDRLHGKLSQNFDIACVFTWIAGLLNLMAIWDAYDGPAYGYGDEEPEDDEDSEAESE